MEESTAIEQFLQTLSWSGGDLSLILGSICMAAYVAWLAWLFVSQLPRLRQGDAMLQTVLAECARGLLVVMMVGATVAFLID